MRIRLKEKVQFAGRVYDRGEEVIIPDGIKGPHRAVRRSHDKIDYSTNPAIDANRDLGKLVDEPLYDVIPDKLPDTDTPPAPPLENTHVEERDKRS